MSSLNNENVGLDHSIHEESATATLTRRLATSRDLLICAGAQATSSGKLAESEKSEKINTL